MQYLRVWLYYTSLHLKLFGIVLYTYSALSGLTFGNGRTVTEGQQDYSTIPCTKSDLNITFC